MNYRFLPISDSTKTLNTPIKCSIAFILVFASCQTYATPSNMGSITVTSSDSSGNASGSYKAAGSGATGTFTLTRNETRGYNNIVDIMSGNNGIEIRNRQDINIANDRFTYTFTITPTDNTAIHTIKIGQASYTTTGNSEVARHTLNFTKSALNDIEVRAFVQNNPSVPYYYEAMGDYFMGVKETTNTDTFTYNKNTSSSQLRENIGNKLYFYRFDFLNGTNLGGNRFRPTTTDNTVNGNVSVRNGSSGFLPTPATFTNILKSTSTNPNNQTTYPSLTSDIANGGQYVSYGIENRASNYVVAVRNASTVTLTYEGIMNGSNGFEGEKIGETYNEWISFGVESEPLNYIFSGTVFNDNGGISDSVADADKVGAPYSSNSNYFNGTFDNNEAGVVVKIGSVASRVRLVNDCVNPTTTYATQILTTADAGAYRFTIPVTEIANRNSVCIIEDNNSEYPIRTTSAKQPVSFDDNQYLYEDINFGRVIDANRALVLLKEQAVNDCSITTLLPNAQNNLNYSKSPLSNIEPGQCIAYRITATNRANLEINKVVITDTLQKRDLNNPSGSKVTSFLNLPERTSNPSKAYNDNVNYGENGTIVTSEFDIPKKKNQVFYFNTKYGTTTTP